MTDRELEERLRAWYRAEVGEGAPAPVSLRQDVAAIPRTTAILIRPLGGRRGFTLLAAAALLLVAGAAVAAGSGLLRLPSLVPPEPAPSSPLISSAPSPSAPSSVVPAMAPSWTATGSMRTPRGGHTATLLPSGKVLVAGGGGGDTVASAELYDPGTGSWTATGAMITPRESATATLLPDGRVLVAGGGRQMTDFTILASAELYDPGTGSWTATGTMGTPRQGGTATLLPDGKVLVAGGINFSRTGIMAGNAVELAAAELYDPSTGSWAATGTMGTPRSGGTATLLPDGKVLVAGGYTDHSASASSSAYSSPSASAELYDPGSGTWTATASMTTPRAGHTAMLLLDGRVLVVGGDDPGFGQLASASAELYDPSSGTWTATRAMVTTGSGFTATLLRAGKVLVAGGAVTKAGGSGSAQLPTAEFLASAELYDPGSGSWTPTASMTAPRMGQTATLLPEGTVLVAGGSDGVGLASAELYDPGSGTPSTSVTSPSPSPSAAASGAPIPALAACGNPGTPAGSAPGTPAGSTPGTPGWTLTGNMTTQRSQHTATLLRDGRVLVAGGAVRSAAELYDPVTRTWAATGSMTTPRTGHTATLLPDGKVLVAGGYVANDSFASAELYDPGSGTSRPPYCRMARCSWRAASATAPTSTCWPRPSCTTRAPAGGP
jgi:hypothetical protein